MTKEDRNLLVQDLCSRLPYGVKVLYKHSVFDIDYISSMYEEVHLDIVNNYTIDVSEVKPYLFPLSSMTEEQKEEIEDKLIFPSNSNGGWIEILYNDIYNIPFWFVDFCNKNHFDYRGLIEKGLAIDCTNLNIY